MRDLNIDFLEEYKSVDNICKDIFGTRDGITEYLRIMENIPWQDYKYVSTWHSDYSKLKHTRWVRNQITHENGTMDSDICSQNDFAWIKDFRWRLLNSNDPLTIIRLKKEEKEKNQRLLQQELKKKQNNNGIKETNNAKEKKSLWERIKKFFWS